LKSCANYILEACTIPFALCTAALGFYQRLDLPFPTASSSANVQPPLIIYGGASAIGAYSLKLAALGSFSKIIVVCGSGSGFVSSLNIATHIIDYRSTDIVTALKSALDGDQCFHAVDAINNGTSCADLAQVVNPNGGKISVYLPRSDYSNVPKDIFLGVTYFGTVHGTHTPFWDRQCKEDVDFGFILFRMISRWLADGRMTGHPYELLPQGLSSVESGLKTLRDENVSAKKFIFRYVHSQLFLGFH
jgi:NADPH2:quinone reductase